MTASPVLSTLASLGHCLHYRRVLAALAPRGQILPCLPANRLSILALVGNVYTLPPRCLYCLLQALSLPPPSVVKQGLQGPVLYISSPSHIQRGHTDSLMSIAEGYLHQGNRQTLQIRPVLFFFFFHPFFFF